METDRQTDRQKERQKERQTETASTSRNIVVGFHLRFEIVYNNIYSADKQ